jgi:hypothetical protein
MPRIWRGIAWETSIHNRWSGMAAMLSILARPALVPWRRRRAAAVLCVDFDRLSGNYRAVGALSRAAR